MATTTDRIPCLTSTNNKPTCSCEGYENNFCRATFQEHRGILNRQLDEIINEHDRSNSTLLRKTSIETIRKTVVIDQIEEKLGQFTSPVRHFREENEIDLQRSTKELTQPSNVSIQEDSQTLIQKIHVSLSNPTQRQESKYHKWKQDATTVAGGNGQGNRMDQLNYPTDVIIDKHNHSIIIADYENRRVIRWFDQSQQIFIDNIDCSDLAMDKEGFLYVSDHKKDEVRRWREEERQGNSLNQLSYPHGLVVDHWRQIYVADQINNRVMRWREGEREGETSSVEMVMNKDRIKCLIPLVYLLMTKEIFMLLIIREIKFRSLI